MRERLEAVASGRVQGVGFRWFVRERAAQFRLAGWVRNRADGAVEVSAEGDPAALDRLIEALAEGPPEAVVDRLEIVSRGPAGAAPGTAPWAGSSPPFEIRPGSHHGD